VRACVQSGTPFGTSLMDTRGQCRFLGMVGLTGSYLFTELDRFSNNQMRYADMARKVKEDDWEGQTKKKIKAHLDALCPLPLGC
jgi:hypothetical protein